LSSDDLKPRLTCGIGWNLSRVIDLAGNNLPLWLKLTDWIGEFLAPDHFGAAREP
jgi:hypothetical protein